MDDEVGDASCEVHALLMIKVEFLKWGWGFIEVNYVKHYHFYFCFYYSLFLRF
jgi:hypothetical protein